MCVPTVHAACITLNTRYSEHGARVPFSDLDFTTKNISQCSQQRVFKRYC